MKNVRLLCLDLATKKSGLAYFENGEYKESYVIDFDKIKDIEERTNLMGEKIINALNYYKPDIVYTEDSFSGNNPKTMKCLSQLHGIAMGWCLINKSEHHLIMPSAWRKNIPGFPNGRSIKRETQKQYSIKYVTDHYGFIPISDDQSDAILIGESIIRKYSE